MTITPLTYIPSQQVEKLLGTVQTNNLGNFYNLSVFTVRHQQILAKLQKQARQGLEKQARVNGADAVIAVHYSPYFTTLQSASTTDDSVGLYAYGEAVKLK